MEGGWSRACGDRLLDFPRAGDDKLGGISLHRTPLETMGQEGQRTSNSRMAGKGRSEHLREPVVGRVSEMTRRLEGASLWTGLLVDKASSIIVIICSLVMVTRVPGGQDRDETFVGLGR